MPEGASWQDEQGRLWDILWMLRWSVTQHRHQATEIDFQLHVQNDDPHPERITLKAVCGPDDDAEPVLTVMLLTED